ncbi:maleylpyruvate isomerase family mycothiol-dependent enzyme [Actinomadura parmotrematis]|uniref:Maleylpyruvate isomerase family mycothiol-dependent enzyme n=1 Tax=Actinomadura parmotrematis TaxID=2864039 RepID=A0ABS7FZM6_9ACTN|nr:maleylpyruvate isomerase family mycothiol-dependent enzyme [Actinomadura parmotrematis]MBW8485400.1 maleylpyruvate isomerase family mycothiol-dependent enzyme [Actinomadura parmotrematis]
MSADALTGLDPFDILDSEAARLDAHFAGLTDAGWAAPSRCAGWSVRDVLGHLAGEELYNHAVLDGTLDDLSARLEREGVKGLDGFNDWTVRERRDRPLAAVLEEWRERSAETRERMRELGPDASLTTMAGPYPNRLQAFHYCSEYATHADDVGALVDPGEQPGRAAWRARVGVFALAEADAPVDVTATPTGYRVRMGDHEADLTAAELADATTNRLPADHPLHRDLREALVCLA